MVDAPLLPKVTCATRKSLLATPAGIVSTTAVTELPPVSLAAADRRTIPGSITYGVGRRESSSLSFSHQLPLRCATDQPIPPGVMSPPAVFRIWTGLM